MGLKDNLLQFFGYRMSLFLNEKKRIPMMAGKSLSRIPPAEFMARKRFEMRAA
jgi:hypothetical protein